MKIKKHKILLLVLFELVIITALSSQNISIIGNIKADVSQEVQIGVTQHASAHQNGATTKKYRHNSFAHKGSESTGIVVTYQPKNIRFFLTEETHLYIFLSTSPQLEELATT